MSSVEPVETPSKREQVFSAAKMVGILTLLLVVLGVSIKKTKAPIIDAVPEAAIATTTEAGSAAAFEEGALAKLRREIENPANSNFGKPVDATAVSDQQADAILDNFLRNVDPASIGTQQPTNSPVNAGNYSTISSADQQAIESRLSPMNGVVKASGNTGRTQQSDGQNVVALPAGTIVEASLVQRVSSDYPGSPFLAKTSRPLYFPDGSLAVESGATLIGVTVQNEGQNAVIANRLPLSVQSIVLSDGTQLPLSAPALDVVGQASIPGHVNKHLLARLGGVLAYAVVGAAATDAASDDPLSSQSSIQQGLITQGAQHLGNAAAPYVQIRPTILPQPGEPIRLILTQPLSLVRV